MVRDRMARWLSVIRNRTRRTGSEQPGTISLLPLLDLPRTPFGGHPETEWLDADEPDGYRARKGHPLYGEHDIRYRFNSYGYRCAEFTTTADLRIVSVGCSCVLGTGLPQAALFHERFAQRLAAQSGRSVVNWNLSSPGASNDYICRVLFLALPTLDPHIVLVNFTYAGRREYVSVQNRLASYDPGLRPRDLIGRELCSHFDALSSPLDDAINIFRNYKAIAALLADRFWLFSTIQPEAFEALAGHIDRDRFAGDLLQVDFARDHGHPGPQSHARLADLYWERFLALQPP